MAYFLIEAKLKAGLLYKHSSIIEIKEVEKPHIDKGEALVAVRGLGLCGSDVKIVHKFIEPPYYPFIIGHEIAGELIDALPSNEVERNIIKLIRNCDNNLIVYLYVGCGVCKYCIKGERNLCYNVRRIGFEINGGLAEYVKVPISNLVPLPKPLTYDYAVLADAGATVLRALKKVKLKPNLNVAVMGVGGLGSLAIQILKISGCKIIAFDKKEEKINYAMELGADIAIDVSNYQKFSGIEDNVDIFLDFVGNKESQILGINTLRKGGKLLQVGYTESTLSEIPNKTLVYKEIKIIGSLGNSINDLYEVIQLAINGYIKSNVTNRYNMEEINNAITDLKENKILGRGIINL
jgi:Zn-dependent alcohol dehydrogenases